MKNKWAVLSASIIILFVVFTMFLYGKKEQIKQSITERTIMEEKEKLKEIKSKYSKYIKTIRKANLYKKENDKYIKTGIVNKGIEIELEKANEITLDTKYFEIKDYKIFISYQDVEKIDKLTEKSHEYKNYIPFDKSIVTKKTKLYKNNNLIYEFIEPMDFEIIIDGENKFVEYHDELYEIKKEDIDRTIDNKNKEEYAKEMAVLNYHFFEEDNKSNCGEIICIKKKNFEKHIKYLSDNKYYTVSMNEFEMFMDKKIRLPKNSVLITVDDGALGTDTILPEIIEKYNMKASLFVITGFNDPKKFTSKSIELHSHTDAMHNQGDCPGGQGGGIKCLPEAKVLADLQKTRDLMNNTTAFAYPFYEYNDRAIELLKKAGFTMAFIGSSKKAVPGTNKMLIPRYPILSTTTVEDIKEKLK
jgi:Predicted xylanase/chitin deacetylase